MDAPLDAHVYDKRQEEDQKHGIIQDDNFAMRDIMAGEELTEHYGYYAGEITPDWLATLMEKYCPGRLWGLGLATKGDASPHPL